MKNKAALTLAVVILMIGSTAFSGEKQKKDGEPIKHQERYSGVRYTYTEPFPVHLLALENDRIQDFYFRGEDFQLDDVNLETVRVGNIPPYTAIRKEGGWLVTDAFIMRFLGASGFRPIPPEGIQSTYTISFDLLRGEHIEMVGDFELEVTLGDLNFDGVANVNDITFLADYIFRGGEECTLFGESLLELMDLDGDGDIDVEDVDYLVALIL